FPDEFVFQCTTQRNLTLIGNAVPPILAHAIATSIAKFLKAIEASLVYNT
ncbi:MAG: DNA cytosine methyltransferase, partial [Lentisphaerae bacterium]|nr:DNA cytosine methyltransferase [Lentisphaerota bacterium]